MSNSKDIENIIKNYLELKEILTLEKEAIIDEKNESLPPIVIAKKHNKNKKKKNTTKNIIDVKFDYKNTIVEL